MNKAFLTSLLGAVALIPAAAHAQKKAVESFTLQVGVNQATNKATRSATQDAGLSLGAGLILPSNNPNAVLSLDGTYDRAAGHGNSLQTTGVFLTERLPASSGKGGSGLYYGAGTGFVQSKYKTAATNVGTTATATSNTKSGAAFRLLAGLKLQGGINAELSYNFNPSVTVGAAKVKTNTLSLTLGKSF